MPQMAIRGMIAVMDGDEITAEVAARLVADQFPQWAGLPVVPVGLNGWDNTTFRLGGRLSVRLPSGEDYVPQVSKAKVAESRIRSRVILRGPDLGCDSLPARRARRFRNRGRPS